MSYLKNKFLLKELSIVLSIVASMGGVNSHANNMNHGAMDHSAMDHSAMETGSRKSLSAATKKSVIAMLESNEGLYNAFLQYDGKSVEANATTLKKSIDAIENMEIAKLLSFSKKKLMEMKASNDRDTNNQNYHLVSMALIHIINKYDVGSKYNAYSCPMVKKKWIQNSSKMKKIHNPYTSKMLYCGSQDSNH